MCAGCSVAVSEAERELYAVLTIKQVHAIQNYVYAKLEYMRCDGSMDE